MKEEFIINDVLVVPVNRLSYYLHFYAESIRYMTVNNMGNIVLHGNGYLNYNYSKFNNPY